jgi:hypothetical protein
VKVNLLLHISEKAGKGRAAGVRNILDSSPEQTTEKKLK